MHLRILFREHSSDVSVHLFYKSSCTISIPLDVLDKFYKMNLYFVNFLFASLLLSCILFVTVELLSWIVRFRMTSS